MSTALGERMKQVETKLEHLETSVERLVDKHDAMDERILSIDKKLDKLIYDLGSYNDRLVKVEKTVNDDILPWKHFIHKLIAVLGIVATVVSIMRFIK